MVSCHRLALSEDFPGAHLLLRKAGHGNRSTQICSPA